MDKSNFIKFVPVLLLLALLAGCVAVDSIADSATGSEASTLPAVEDDSAGENSIVGQTWRLQELQMANGDALTPEGDAEYTLLLADDGSLTGQADCNRINSTYTLDGSQISFDDVASTRALCPPGSLFGAYVQALDTASDYTVTDGTLELAFGTGDTAIFAPAADEEAADSTQEAVGIYKGIFPAASSPGIDSTLYLNTDNTARLVSDYLNDEAPIVEVGDWQVANDNGGDNEVTVTFTGQEDRAYNTPQTTTFMLDDNALTSVPSDTDSGALGQHYLRFDALATGDQAVPYDAAPMEQPDDLTGIYKGFAPAASCCGLDLTLTLSPDGSATLKNDYLNGDAPFLESGTWKTTEGTLEVELDDADSMLTFEVSADPLTLVSNDLSIFGKAPLRFYSLPAIALSMNGGTE